jgi:Quinohemoprotein amine dehydrogenase A, alpha subunit, haem binding/Quinohemoprotein amine dehydrogenase, alpha subunit domain II
VRVLPLLGARRAAAPHGGEWRKLAHFHLGQYPTTEYQALGRDRNWWELASEELPPQLAERFPLETPEWNAWKEREPVDLSGRWRFVGRDPSAGDYRGVATIESTGDDTYSVTLEATYADGRQIEGEGSGIVYTGFEWRSRVRLLLDPGSGLGGRPVRRRGGPVPADGGGPVRLHRPLLMAGQRDWRLLQAVFPDRK